ncbi:MAG: DUF952 domain-containing protein [Hellea sp.]|nr:DUF952 domain-containing protein [Hellea sp.]
MSEPVYKLLTAYQWKTLDHYGEIKGTPLDTKDGYIHLSTAAQVVETARLHFKDKGPLVLVEFMAEHLGKPLIYEPARDGSLFPHLYDNLRRSQVSRFWPLRDLGGGEYSFPDEFL